MYVVSTFVVVQSIELIVLQDLEFASVIVQKLSIILITSPELADFRKRLKSHETRVCDSSASNVILDFQTLLPM